MKKIINHFSEMWYMYVLFLLVVLVTVAFAKLSSYEDQTGDSWISTYQLTDFEREDVTAVSYRNRSGEVIAFHRVEGDNWVYTPDESLQVKQDGPRYLMEILRNVSSEYQVESPEDMSIYGLSDACPYLQIETAQETRRIYVGEFNEGVKRYYAYVEGDPSVYGLTVDVAEVLDFTLKNYIEGEF